MNNYGNCSDKYAGECRFFGKGFKIFGSRAIKWDERLEYFKEMPFLMDVYFSAGEASSSCFVGNLSYFKLPDSIDKKIFITKDIKSDLMLTEAGLETLVSRSTLIINLNYTKPKFSIWKCTGVASNGEGMPTDEEIFKSKKNK